MEQKYNYPQTYSLIKYIADRYKRYSDVSIDEKVEISKEFLLEISNGNFDEMFLELFQDKEGREKWVDFVRGEIYEVSFTDFLNKEVHYRNYLVLEELFDEAKEELSQAYKNSAKANIADAKRDYLLSL
jgi:hypothetical protein